MRCHPFAVLNDLYNFSNHKTNSYPKILLVNDRPLRTGAGRYAYQIYNALPDISYLVSYIWNYNEVQLKFPGEVVISNLIKQIPNPNKLTMYLIRFTPRLMQRDYISLISNFRKKGYFVHYSSQLAYTAKPFDSDTVSILDLIAIKDAIKQPINYLLLKKYLRFNHIITISNYTSKLIRTYRPDSHPHTIYPYVSESFFGVEKKTAREKLKIPLDKKIILSISSTQMRKNLSVVEKTMNLLGNEYLLVRVGEPISNSISFQNVDDATLNLIYNSADVLLFPTKAEGFGYPLIEAMKVGLPIVSSNIEVVREVTAGNALLAEQDDPIALSNMIRDAVSSPEDLIKRGLKRANFFNKQRLRNELLMFYAKLTELLE